MEYAIGSTVFGSWTITKEIGEGGFGKVYEVRNNKGNIETASALKVIRIPRSVSDVKYIRSQGMDDQSVTEYFHGFVDRLAKEIATMSRLKDHPNIVKYEDHQVIPRAGEFGWDILIRMELLTPFTDYYMDHGLSPKEICRLGKEMCSALVFCHQQGIIHRDVKPSNIFVNRLGMFKLGDFGVSRTMGKSTGTARQGTESYMAPEVYLGRHYGANVDIYSLGMMLYQLMNGGRLPFFPPAGQIVGYGDEDAALQRRMSGEPFPPPAGASPEFAEIILKACAYDPNARYPDGQALLEDLNRLAFAPEPLAGLQKKTVSFMDLAKGGQEVQEEPVPPAPEPPSIEPVAPPVSFQQEPPQTELAIPPEPPKQEQPPENPDRFHTQSPFDRLGGKPTDWQQSPLSGEKKEPEMPVCGTTPVAKVSVPPQDPDRTEPGRAAMNAGSQNVGGWKQAPAPQGNPQNRAVTPSHVPPAPKPAQKSGGAKVAVGIVAGIGAAVLLIFLIARLFAGGDAHSADNTRQSSAPASQTVSGAPGAKSDADYITLTVPRELDIRSSPRYGSTPVATASPGDEIMVLNVEDPGQWDEVLYDGQTGYVQRPLLDACDVGILTGVLPKLCDAEGNVIATADEGTAVYVEDYLLLQSDFYFLCTLDDQEFYVKRYDLQLSEWLAPEKEEVMTLRAPLGQVFTQPDSSGDYAQPLNTVEAGTALSLTPSVVRPWYILSTTNGPRYVQGIYFEEYYRALFAEDRVEQCAWKGAYDRGKITMEETAPEDAAFMAQWEKALKRMLGTLQTGPDAPDYLTLTQEGFSSAMPEISPYFYSTSQDAVKKRFYYEEGAQQGLNEEEIEFERTDSGSFSLQGSTNTNRTDASPEEEAREREQLNRVMLLPRGVRLGDAKEDVLRTLGITQEMIDWLGEDEDRRAWYDVADVYGEADSYDTYYSGKGSLTYISISGGPCAVGFSLSFSNTDGTLFSFGVNIKQSDLLFPDGIPHEN